MFMFMFMFMAISLIILAISEHTVPPENTSCGGIFEGITPMVRGRYPQ